MIHEDMTRTIYSVCYPPAKKTLENLLLDTTLHNKYEETWTKKQDSYHHDFINTWKEWSASRLKFNHEKLSHFYPTNGSSEAIREQLALLYSQGKTLVVFDGEYEGYEAIANALGMPVKKINCFRNNSEVWKDIELLNPKKDVFFLSEPSSIDGCCWKEIYKFLEITKKLNLSVYLDLAYIGASRQQNQLDISKYDNIDGIFFSLSKVFGVYYHRIGGVLLKNANSLLYGNMWFKNILALEYGTKLMQDNPIGFFDQKLNILQKKAIEVLEEKYNVKLIPSDVFLIANVKYEPEIHMWHKEFQRSNKSHLVRVCVSPTLEKIMRQESN